MTPTNTQTMIPTPDGRLQPTPTNLTTTKIHPTVYAASRNSCPSLMTPHPSFLIYVPLNFVIRYPSVRVTTPPKVPHRRRKCLYTGFSSVSPGLWRN